MLTTVDTIISMKIPKEIKNIIDSQIDHYDLKLLKVDCFTKAVMDSTIEEVEKIIINEPKKLRKKVFQISIELTQNLYLHSKITKETENSENNNLGFFILTKISNFAYKISTGNFVNAEKKNFLESYLSYLKSLTSEELKSFYFQVLEDKRFTEKGGGGLGFIEIIKKSNRNFDFKFIKFNLDLYLFVFNAIVSIENQV